MSENPIMRKEAAVTQNNFIRKTWKERSFGDKIIEPRKISADELYKHPTSTDKLWYMLEIEPECPVAMEMAYNTPSPIATFNARRTLISFDRIKSIRLQKEINELLTWSVSLRDIMADNQTKELEDRFDLRFISTINACVGTRPGVRLMPTGSVHFREIHDGFTYNSFAESLKYIPSLGGVDWPNGLTSKTLLMNNITYTEFAKWPGIETGYDFTSGVLKNGLQEFENGLMNLKFIVTIKRRLVPDGSVYHFGDPDYIGQQLVWIEPTMIVKQQDHSVSFYVFCERTGAIFVHLGLARVDYAGVSVDG
jgi:hypothetical protein